MTPSKIVCVGRNYAEHAAELGNSVPDTPILFIKPSSSLRQPQDGITWDRALGSCHYETELCVKIGQTLTKVDANAAFAAIDGVTLGLDLTLRDLQNELKDKGYPWERAKAFDGACILGNWLPFNAVKDIDNTYFTLTVNNQICQQGDTAQMIVGVADLISFISHNFTLYAGDVVMTGTPKGVAALHSGDQLVMTLHTRDGEVEWRTSVN